MIDIGKFARPHIDPKKGNMGFGVSTPKAIADVLREFADKIESGHVIVQNIQLGAIASIDNFPMEALFIEYAEYKPAEDAAEVKDELKNSPADELQCNVYSGRGFAD